MIVVTIAINNNDYCDVRFVYSDADKLMFDLYIRLRSRFLLPTSGQRMELHVAFLISIIRSVV